MHIRSVATQELVDFCQVKKGTTQWFPLVKYEIFNNLQNITTGTSYNLINTFPLSVASTMA